jgi:hypothetical protein
VNVPAGVAAKANAPTPSARATKKASIGKGKAAVSTANAGDDTDSFWVEEIDIDGDGTAEATDVLWDDEDKVLFLYAEGEFPVRVAEPVRATCSSRSMGRATRAVARRLRLVSRHARRRRVQGQGCRRLRVQVRREGHRNGVRCGDDRREERRARDRDSVAMS